MTTRLFRKIQLRISKIFILLMVSIYALQPIHEELVDFLHEVVHIFERPDAVLTHSKTKDIIALHESKVHKEVLKNHNHIVTDIIAKVVNHKSQKGEMQHVSFILKLHKYFPERIQTDYLKNTSIVQVKNQYFKNIHNNLSKGYPFTFKKPPQEFINKKHLV